MGVIKNRSKIIPVAHLAAPGGGHAVEGIGSEFPLFHKGAVHQRAGRRDRHQQPAIGRRLFRQQHIEPVPVFEKAFFAAEGKVLPQKRFVEGMVHMNPGQRHFVTAVAVGKVLPVGGFSCPAPKEPRHRDVLLVPDIRGIGKGPQVLPLRHTLQRFLNPPVIFPEGRHRLPGALRHRSVDLRLIFAEIPDDMIVIGKRMAGVGKEALPVHPKALPLQAKIAPQEKLSDFRMFRVQHGYTLPFPPSLPMPSAGADDNFPFRRRSPPAGVFFTGNRWSALRASSSERYGRPHDFLPRPEHTVPIRAQKNVVSRQLVLTSENAPPRRHPDD